ncbi:CLUMA_CG021486, isoform A [Clunio marinus]|uniref:CLUMA_CG021486, isoform A n=1 Tax=Clunio marinus TaxID=568069 RepID=A0A1J1J7T1_9DIPT|nr:CLUMA_CG021486, isoform A [Clunio marinus]
MINSFTTSSKVDATAPGIFKTKCFLKIYFQQGRRDKNETVKVNEHGVRLIFHWTYRIFDGFCMKLCGHNVKMVICTTHGKSILLFEQKLIMPLKASDKHQ